MTLPYNKFRWMSLTVIHIKEISNGRLLFIVIVVVVKEGKKPGKIIKRIIQSVIPLFRFLT